MASGTDDDMGPGAVGVGLATFAAGAEDEPLLDVHFAAFRRGGWPAGADGPSPPGPTGTTRLEEDRAAASAVARAGLAEPDAWAALVGDDDLRGVRRRVVSVRIDDLGDPPVDAGDVYLRLHLLSARLARPHGLNLDGVFGLLRNVAWTSEGPCDAEHFDTTRFRLLADGRHPHVHAVDKFPPMLDYVVPTGVRIADASRVRLGAHLAPGTTVMHEGFCNFNAGTLGTSMVEGRISAGVVVGAESDVGGGASIMGTLSGGGREVVSVGERCLIGANAGIGISLGDDCVVEAGLYVTAGTLVTLPDGEVVKGRVLSGASGLLYRRHGVTGRIEAVPRQGVTWAGLNAALHANA